MLLEYLANEEKMKDLIRIDVKLYNRILRLLKKLGDFMKILIIGSVGSGKSTYARMISVKLNIKVYEIDLIVHDDKTNTKRTIKEQDEIIASIEKNNSWIIEGTLRKNLQYLLDISDKIVFLDVPYNVRKRRILTRFIKQKTKIEKCSYKPTLKMLKMMLKWNKQFEENKGRFCDMLNNYKNKLEIIKI